MPRNMKSLPDLDDEGGEDKFVVEGTEEILLTGSGGGGGELEILTSGAEAGTSVGGGGASPEDWYSGCSIFLF